MNGQTGMSRVQVFAKAMFSLALQMWDGFLVFSILYIRSKQGGLSFFFAREIIADLLTKASDGYRPSPHIQPGEGAFASCSGIVCVCVKTSRWKEPRIFGFSCVVVDHLQAWENIWATTLQLDMENLSVQAGNQSSKLFFKNFYFRYVTPSSPIPGLVDLFLLKEKLNRG